MEGQAANRLTFFGKIALTDGAKATLWFFQTSRCSAWGRGGVHVTLLAEQRQREAACSVRDCAAARALF